MEDVFETGLKDGRGAPGRSLPAEVERVGADSIRARRLVTHEVICRPTTTGFFVRKIKALKCLYGNSAVSIGCQFQSHK